MGYGGYFKGEKKKPKKDKGQRTALSEFSSFALPEIVSKKKKGY